MKRHCLLVLLLVAVGPGLAHAQDEKNWGAVLRITPTAGFSPKFTQHGEAEIVTSNAVPVHQYELEYASGLPVGLNVELRFFNRFSVIAGGSYTTRGEGRITDLDDDLAYRTAGSSFFMTKLGLAIRLREEVPDIQLRQMNGSIFVAPALIRDHAKDSPFVPVGAVTNAQHYGVNFGAEAELPLASRHLALNIALEDWLIFWNQEESLTRVAAYLEQTQAQQTVIAIEAGKSHVLVLRGGLTFKF